MYMTNVVYVADLKCQFNLSKLTKQLTDVRYDPKRFPGLIWQHKRIGGNCLLFSNGKINCNGKSTSFNGGKRRLRQYARRLQKLGYNVRLTNVKPITASAFHKLSGPLQLNKLAEETGSRYEPEIFPALLLKKDGVTFSCFHTGTVVITGIKKNICMCERVYLSHDLRAGIVYDVRMFNNGCRNNNHG